MEFNMFGGFLNMIFSDVWEFGIIFHFHMLSIIIVQKTNHRYNTDECPYKWLTPSLWVHRKICESIESLNP